MKRLLSIMLVAAMLLTIPVMPVNAWSAEADGGVTDMEEICPCPCGQKLSQVDWQPWDPDAAQPPTGHYYLEDDYLQKRGAKTVIANNHIVLDLRGHTWTSKAATSMSEASYRMLNIEGYFYLMDTAGGGLVSPQLADIYGGAFLIKMNEFANPTFTMLSGTIRPTAGETNTVAAGLLYNVNGTFVMKGGCIADVHTTGAGGQGGAIRSAAGSVTRILGGTIMNCTTGNGGDGGAIFSDGGEVELSNCTITGCTAGRWGGAVSMAGGMLTVNNATLANNIAKCLNNNGGQNAYNGGGNIFLRSGAVATVTNSTIHNGYGTNYGGNIYTSGSTLTLKDSSVTDGVAKKMGANMHLYQSTVTIDGTTVSGDTGVDAGTLNLKNKTKVNLNNTGLRLVNAPTVNASELSTDAMVYVDATGTFTAAGANISNFRGAIRTVITDPNGTGALVAAKAASGQQGGYCPHCSTVATWSEYTGTPGAGHFYLTENRTGGISVTSSANMVLDLAGKTITGPAASRAVTVSAGTQMAFLDSVGGGTVQGGGSANYGGAVIFNNGTLRIFGGLFKYTPDTRVVQQGGVIYNNLTTRIVGGVFDGSGYNNTSTEAGIHDTTNAQGAGGVFYQSAGKRLIMEAGHMIGGTAYQGGTAFFAAGSNVNITAGTFTGGTAANDGGNLYFAGTSTSGTVTVSNISVTDGEATGNNGGNMFIGKATTNTFTNCYVSGGTSKNYGGNIIFGAGSNAVLKNSIVTVGKSANGGNIHIPGLSCSVTLEDSMITFGKATVYGGNVYFNHGINTVKGCEISFGNAKEGGNVYANAGNHASGSTNKTTFQKSGEKLPRLLGGKATDKGGNIAVYGDVVLTDAYINGGKATAGGNDIYLAAGAVRTKLTTGAGLVGSMTMMVDETLINAPVYGQPIANTVTTGTLSNATVMLEGDYGLPHLLANEGVLYVSGAATVDGEGSIAWYLDSSAALANCPADGYMKLYNNTEVTLSGDAHVDLNGTTATFSGSGRLYGMDSSGDGYDEPAGKAIITGSVSAPEETITYARNGYKYYAIKNGSEVVYHRVGMELINVTIRPTETDSGIYFQAAFGADQTMRGLIQEYGVAVSLAGVPTESMNGSLRSVFPVGTMVNDELKNGMLVRNIMKDTLNAAQNDTRGRDEIYAAAYVKLNNGAVLLSDDSTTTADDVDYSLYDVMTKLNGLIENEPESYRRYTNAMRDYYGWWKDNGMNTWSLNRMQPANYDDGVIDVLMIGSSFCTYYVEEMWHLAQAAGYELRVCNVYYSGCPLSKYYNDWVNKYADYQFYETTGPERTYHMGVKSLEWCLMQGDWDVISMQESSFNVKSSGSAAAHLTKTATYTEALFPYICEQFPNADFYFHQTWSYQVGYDRNGYAMTSAQQQANDQAENQEFALGLLEKFNAAPYDLGMGRIPTGEAWQIMRQEYNYDKLCARIKVKAQTANEFTDPDDDHEGDYYHDGDIGGGQYLNACVWLQTILQKIDPNFDIRTITSYTPSYSYSSNNVDVPVDIRFDPAQIREAAYKAVKTGWSQAN